MPGLVGGLAWLDGEEPALSRVNEVIGQHPVISWINLVEVAYRVERDHGRHIADETPPRYGPRSPQNSQAPLGCSRRRG